MKFHCTMSTRVTKSTRLRHGWLLTIESPCISHSQLLKHLSSVVELDHVCIYDLYAPEAAMDLASVSCLSLQCHFRCHFKHPMYTHPALDRHRSSPYVKTCRYVCMYMHLKTPVSLHDTSADCFNVKALDVCLSTLVPVGAFQCRFNAAVRHMGPMLTTYSPLQPVPRADLPDLPFGVCSPRHHPY